MRTRCLAGIELRGVLATSPRDERGADEPRDGGGKHELQAAGERNLFLSLTSMVSLRQRRHRTVADRRDRTTPEHGLHQDPADKRGSPGSVPGRPDLGQKVSPGGLLVTRRLGPEPRLDRGETGEQLGDVVLGRRLLRA